MPACMKENQGFSHKGGGVNQSRARVVHGSKQTPVGMKYSKGLIGKGGGINQSGARVSHLVKVTGTTH